MTGSAGPTLIDDPMHWQLESYRLLFGIEAVLRELILERLSACAGPFWYNTRLPPDARAKYLEKRSIERRTPWITLIPYHPIYYVDFPHLREIITRKDNWKDAFKSIFLRTEEVQVLLANLEPVRNRLAHSRFVTAADHERLSLSNGSIRSALGDAYFITLFRRAATVPSIRQDLDHLRSHLGRSLRLLEDLEPLEDPQAAVTIIEQWWLDDDYLGVPTTGISETVSLLLEYARLPRHRGSGPAIDRWTSEHDLHSRCAAALRDVQALLDERVAQ